MIPMCPHGLGVWHWLSDIGAVLAMVGATGTVFWACCKMKFNVMFRRKPSSTMTEEQADQILRKRV